MLPPDVNAGRLPLRAARCEVASATGWARSRAPAKAAIGHIIEERSRGGALQGPLRLLPSRRQAHRQPAHGRIAGARRRIRSGQRPSREPARFGRDRARERGAGEPRGEPGEPLRRARARRRRAVALRRACRAGTIASGCRTRSSRWATTSRAIRSASYERELRQLHLDAARPAHAAALPRAARRASSTACASR